MKSKQSGQYAIPVFSLSTGKHAFEFKIDSAFLQDKKDGIIRNANCMIALTLDKSETMIQVRLILSGHVGLICDRSLEAFDFPLNHTHILYYKYGESFEELSEDVFMVPYDTHSLDFSSLIYEFMLLALPVKKLHPKFATEEETQGFIYSTDTTSRDEDEILHEDERWNKLKNIKL